MAFGFGKKPFNRGTTRFFDLLTLQSGKTLEGLDGGTRRAPDVDVLELHAPMPMGDPAIERRHMGFASPAASRKEPRSLR